MPKKNAPKRRLGQAKKEKVDKEIQRKSGNSEPKTQKDPGEPELPALDEKQTHQMEVIQGFVTGFSTDVLDALKQLNQMNQAKKIDDDASSAKNKNFSKYMDWRATHGDNQSTWKHMDQVMKSFTRSKKTYKQLRPMKLENCILADEQDKETLTSTDSRWLIRCCVPMQNNSCLDRVVCLDVRRILKDADAAVAKGTDVPNYAYALLKKRLGADAVKKLDLKPFLSSEFVELTRLHHDIVSESITVEETAMSESEYNIIQSVIAPMMVHAMQKIPGWSTAVSIFNKIPGSSWIKKGFSFGWNAFHFVLNNTYLMKIALTFLRLLRILLCLYIRFGSLSFQIETVCRIIETSTESKLVKIVSLCFRLALTPFDPKQLVGVVGIVWSLVHQIVSDIAACVPFVGSWFQWGLSKIKSLESFWDWSASVWPWNPEQGLAWVRTEMHSMFEVGIKNNQGLSKNVNDWMWQFLGAVIICVVDRLVTPEKLMLLFTAIGLTPVALAIKAMTSDNGKAFNSAKQCLLELYRLYCIGDSKLYDVMRTWEEIKLWLGDVLPCAIRSLFEFVGMKSPFKGECCELPEMKEFFGAKANSQEVYKLAVRQHNIHKSDKSEQEKKNELLALNKDAMAERDKTSWLPSMASSWWPSDPRIKKMIRRNVMTVTLPRGNIEVHKYRFRVDNSVNGQKALEEVRKHAPYVRPGARSFYSVSAKLLRQMYPRAVQKILPPHNILTLRFERVPQPLQDVLLTLNGVKET